MHDGPCLGIMMLKGADDLEEDGRPLHGPLGDLLEHDDPFCGRGNGARDARGGERGDERDVHERDAFDCKVEICASEDEDDSVRL